MSIIGVQLRKIYMSLLFGQIQLRRRQPGPLGRGSDNSRLAYHERDGHIHAADGACREALAGVGVERCCRGDLLKGRTLKRHVERADDGHACIRNVQGRDESRGRFRQQRQTRLVGNACPEVSLTIWQLLE